MQRDLIKVEHDTFAETRKVEDDCSTTRRLGEYREEEHNVRNKQWPVYMEPYKSS